MISVATFSRALSAFAMSLVLVATAHAHPARLVDAQAIVESDGSYRLSVRFDLLAYLLNETPRNATDTAMNALLDGPTPALESELVDAASRFRADATILCDGVHELRAESVVFPTLASVERWKRAAVTPRLPVIGEATLAGHLPGGTHTIAFRVPEVIGDIVLTVERPGEEPWGEPVQAGALSSPLSVHVGSSTATSAATSAATMTVDTAAPAGRLQTSLRFVQWGFLHIVPRGLDHILFVLGLYLLDPRLKPVLWQVTAFTVAHAMTLALSTLGLVHLSPGIVEPLIAASIAFVAIENLFTRELKPWRPFVVFAFGLVHGLGFADVLLNSGLPRGQWFTGLIAFNVGIELGQLTVVAMAVFLFGRFRNRSWYRRSMSMPASALIATIAIVWTITRTVDGLL